MSPTRTTLLVIVLVLAGLLALLGGRNSNNQPRPSQTRETSRRPVRKSGV